MIGVMSEPHRMVLPADLDLGLLRTLVAIAEEMSFTRAAQRVGRTQSAVSLQMQRLEAMLGQALIERGKGGSVELTPHGRYLLGRAHEIIALNDDIMSKLREQPEGATLRVGVAGEFPKRHLSRILQDFMGETPHVVVDVVSDLSCKLAQMLKLGELDLAVVERGLEPRLWPAEEVLRARLRWITSSIHLQHLEAPMPVTIAPAACEWRPPWLTQCLWSGMALGALDKAGKPYRVVSRSLTTDGQLAMVRAGKAVMVSLDSLELSPDLRFVEPAEGLPELPSVAFLLLLGKQRALPETARLSGHFLKGMTASQVQQEAASPTSP